METPDYWYKANGVPVPSKKLNRAQALAYLEKCRKAKDLDEIKKIAESL